LAALVIGSMMDRVYQAMLSHAGIKGYHQLKNTAGGTFWL